ncbi:MAG TPA: type II secretion system F family protein [Rickettsiales bacterium]|nr:type II secretion system F family protein [Rickettsiales bacterium]
MNRKYIYRALDQKRNKVVKGTMQTANEFALEQTLLESNLILISYKEIGKGIFSNLSFLDRITSKDLITFFIHLEQLEKAGVPLLDSLSDLKDFSNNQKMKDVASDLFESVKGGKLLSEAMGKYPRVFTEITISLVKMGEKTGGLQIAFKNIYENIKWAMEIKRATIKAIRYPLFTLFVMFIVTGIMLKIVVPKVTGFILDQGIAVPWYTTALIKTSEFFQNYFFSSIVYSIIIYILIKILSKNKVIKLQIDSLKLKIPILGDIITKIEMSKFTKFFGVTFSSGIPVLECLTISGNIVRNSVLREEIERIQQQVSDGKSVSNAMSSSGYFPNMVLRMLKVGEESGNMGEAMENIQYFYTSEINDTIETIIGALQPTIMFIMGGLMGWVIAGVFGPIYGNFDNFGV